MASTRTTCIPRDRHQSPTHHAHSDTKHTYTIIFVLEISGIKHKNTPQLQC